MFEQYDAGLTLTFAKERAARFRAEADADRLAKSARRGSGPRDHRHRARRVRLWPGHGEAGSLPPALP
jgi:hypothetical protein